MQGWALHTEFSSHYLGWNSSTWSHLPWLRDALAEVSNVLTYIENMNREILQTVLHNTEYKEAAHVIVKQWIESKWKDIVNFPHCAPLNCWTQDVFKQRNLRKYLTNSRKKNLQMFLCRKKQPETQDDPLNLWFAGSTTPGVCCPILLIHL